METYHVGTIYHSDKHQWSDGTDFNYRNNVLELRMFMSDLTSRDIYGINNGACSFAFTVLDDIIFLLYQFDDFLSWGDSSYSIHLLSIEDRTLPPILDSCVSIPLTIVLVSSEDGIIRALRRIALGHTFSKALFDAIRKQYKTPFNASIHLRNIAKIYRQYPEPQDMLPLAISSCVVKSRDNLN